MSHKQSPLACSLRRQHHLLWLLLGVGFSLFLSSQLVQEGAASIGLLIALLALYSCAGRWAANMVVRLTVRSASSRPAAALYVSSFKVGALFAILSTLFHLVLLGIQNGNVSLDLLQSSGPILLRAALLPLLACMGAACTISGRAWTEETEMVQYPETSGVSSLAD